MLILSRKSNECIMIDDDICLTVLDIKGNQVRIGIEAPLTHAIHRREIYDKIKAIEERQCAQKADPNSIA